MRLTSVSNYILILLFFVLMEFVWEEQFFGFKGVADC